MSGRRGTALFAAVFLAVAGSASAATPKPWQWTAKQAAATLLAENPALPWEHRDDADPSVERQLGGTVTKTACAPRGTRYGKRYAAFQCRVTWKPDAKNLETRTISVWAKVRKTNAPSLCLSMRSLASVPTRCLATEAGRVMTTEVGAAGKALLDRYGHHPIRECWAHGSGFFACWTGAASYAITIGKSGARVVKTA